MIQLTQAQQRAYMSDYLENGWREERMSFSSVSLEPGYIDGRINVEHFQMPGDGRFHFSAQSAMIWISQLGIIYGCWDNQLSKKAGEVYLRDLDIKFKRTINTTEEVRFEGFFPKQCKKRLSDNLVYYKNAQIHVEGGAFTGTASFLVPTG
ncbi:hypothetical protein [Pseudoalteromonas rubra]|uniref:Thioesterase n=1 Tax=Pseudoalteromonas rubra TaxID=43658 RepID=A0A4V2E215_9GAMM|nr:hypothetical protein [Pseudoalteromonas rubra]RZM76465.1 hypothetical protein C3B51_18030 [Pseudoalteromonas rubra]